MTSNPSSEEDLPPAVNGSELDPPGSLWSRRSVAVFPTLCTLANALAGFMAVFLASRPFEPSDLPLNLSPLTLAAVCVFLGMLFDAFDGQIARLMRSTSDLGEQLDSMADMVSFGVAPAFMAVQIAGVQNPFLTMRGDRYFDRAALLIACVYVACAALRLARYNTEAARNPQRDQSRFRGLPSPGAAGTVASLVLLHQHLIARDDPAWHVTVAAVGILAIMLLAAGAMVSRLPYVHIPNRYLRRHAPFKYLAVALMLVPLLATYPQWTLAVGFTAYALSAPAWWLWHLRGSRSSRGATRTPGP